MNPRAGRLDQKIEIQRQTLEPADFGLGSEQWELLRYCWAQVRQNTATEMLRGGQMIGLGAYLVTIRRHPSKPLASSDRIVWRGRTLEIKAVVEAFTRDDELSVVCEEVVS